MNSGKIWYVCWESTADTTLAYYGCSVWDSHIHVFQTFMFFKFKPSWVRGGINFGPVKCVKETCFTCWICMRNKFWSTFDLYKSMSHSLITCLKSNLVHIEKLILVHFWFSMQPWVRKWTKIYFSILSKWTKSLNTWLENDSLICMNQKWTKIYFAYISSTWNTSPS